MRDFLRLCREHYHYHVAKQEGRGDEAAFQRVLDLLNTAEVEPSPHEPNSKVRQDRRRPALANPPSQAQH
jgi:transcription elongation GreA/GreB family factor